MSLTKTGQYRKQISNLMGLFSRSSRLQTCRRFNYATSVQLQYYKPYGNANRQQPRDYSNSVQQLEIDQNTFTKVCEETLESLTEYFEEICEATSALQAADVSYSSGVLTVFLGDKYGTYVINRQSPNKQIWLSSPTSGPKRYDLVTKGSYWIYKHDGQTLHQLLQNEISQIIKDVDFSKCAHSKLQSKC